MIWGSYVKCMENGELPGIYIWQYHFTIFGYVFVVIHSAINMPLYYILNVKLRKKLFCQSNFFDQRPILRKPIRNLSEVKGEPDGASEPILAEGRRLSDFSSTTVIAPTLKISTALSQSSPDVGARDTNETFNESLSISHHNITTTNEKILLASPELTVVNQKPVKGTLKRKMTIAKSSMTPLVARQNTIED